MIKHLLILGFLVCFLMIPAMSFAENFSEAQVQLLESSNIDAWKMLEAGAMDESADGPNFVPILDAENSDPFSGENSDDIVPIESVPPQVPEPTTMVLLGLGLLGIGARRKLRK